MTWNEFQNVVFRLSNMGFYVRWTASNHTDGRKSIFAMDLSGIYEDAPIWGEMREKGFENRYKGKTDTGYFLWEFVSPIIN